MINPELLTWDWTSRSKDYEVAGKVLHTWFDEARHDASKSLLLIVGAGLSMTGAAPAPSGGAVGHVLENFLLTENITIPQELLGTGDIAKLYEFYCYSMDGDRPHFDLTRHSKFAAQVTSSIGGVYLSGEPNEEHRALEREVASSSGGTRIYSLNVDDFFQQAVSTRLTLTPPTERVVNAAALVDKQHSPDFCKWGILAAHGTRETRSVWSERLLGNSLLNLNDEWKDEREVLRSASRCISQGPEYYRIVFAGVNAPLIYLLEPLIAKASPELQWMWINPSSPPQPWLRTNNSVFRPDNGMWAKTGITDISNQYLFDMYDKWMRVSCRQTVNLISWGRGTSPMRKKQSVVRAIHRTRRLYFEAEKVLADSAKPLFGNTQKLDQYQKCTYAYDPPKLENHQYQDRELAVVLRELHNHNIIIFADPGDSYPKLTVAKGQNEEVSVQILKVASGSEITDVANAIAMNVQECIECNFESALDRGHIIIVDTALDYIWRTLYEAINSTLAQSFANHGVKPKIHVLKFDDILNLNQVLAQFTGRVERL